MINLLPKESRANLFREYRLRKILVFEIVVFVLAIISLIFLGVLYYSVFLEGENNKLLLQEAREDSGGETLSTLQAGAKDLRVKLGFFEKFDQDDFVIANLIEEVVLQKPNGIHISTLSFDRDENRMLVVRGNADTRDELLLFTQRLENLSFAEGVDSPVTNIIQETEILFTVNIRVKGEINNE